MRGIRLAVAVMCSGCSFLFQERLPDPYVYERGSEPRCSTSPGWALLDGAFGALNAAFVVDQMDKMDANSLAVGAAVLEGSIFVLSGILGDGWSGDCSDARAEYDRRKHDPRDVGGPTPDAPTPDAPARNPRRNTRR